MAFSRLTPADTISAILSEYSPELSVTLEGVSHTLERITCCCLQTMRTRGFSRPATSRSLWKRAECIPHRRPCRLAGDRGQRRAFAVGSRSFRAVSRSLPGAYSPCRERVCCGRHARAGLAGWRRSPSCRCEIPLATLPQQYFVDGMTEALTTSLAQIRSPRSSRARPRWSTPPRRSRCETSPASSAVLCGGGGISHWRGKPGSRHRPVDSGIRRHAPLGEELRTRARRRAGAAERDCPRRCRAGRGVGNGRREASADGAPSGAFLEGGRGQSARPLSPRRGDGGVAEPGETYQFTSAITIQKDYAAAYAGVARGSDLRDSLPFYSVSSLSRGLPQGQSGC